MRIGKKLMLWYVAIAILIGAAGYFSASSVQKALIISIGDSTVFMAEHTIEEVDRNIYQKIENFEEYTRDLLLLNTLIASNNTFEKMDDSQKYIVEKNLEWLFYSKGHDNPLYEKIISNRLSREVKEKVTFYEKKYGYKVIAEIIVTNRYGANIALSGLTTDYKQDDEAWWTTAKEKE